MGKGSYTGGSTIIGPQSGWFTRTEKMPPRKPLTIERLAKDAKRAAKAARTKQAKDDAFFASIQGLPSTIGTTAAQGKRQKKRSKTVKRNSKR